MAQKQPEGPARRGALYPAFDNEIIPHITHGGNWHSSLIVMKVSQDPAFYRIKFYSPDGTAARFKIQSLGEVDELYGTLTPGGSTRIKSIEDSSPTETRYWAEIVDGSGKIQVTVVFSWTIPGNTPMGVTVPNVSYGALDGIYFPFDNTEGYSTAFAFANASTYSDEAYRIEARNEAGISIFSTTLNLQRRRQMADLLPQRFPELAGQKGVIIIKPEESSLLYCAPLILQFRPEGSVTYIPAYDEY
ncbi:MAG: hypothetical protein LC114_24290 [Bryobacterales bacterium]|nr:hypothetical protein [Bryobacterales bacterium]